MKTIKVVCGIYIKNKKVLIAQRNYGSAKGIFEFPGGKVEENESLEDALIREWKEECNVDIQKETIRFLSKNVDVQDNCKLDLTCFTFTSKDYPELNDHTIFIWTTPSKIYKYNFFKADKILVDTLNEEWQCLIKQMK